MPKVDKNTEILINDKKLLINQFTNDIVTNSITGIVRSLKTEENVRTIAVEISNIVNENLVDAKITLKANGKDVKINAFTSGILKETIFAMINTLKIDDEINSIKIAVEE